VKSNKLGSAKKRHTSQRKKGTKVLDALSRKSTDQSKNKRGRHNLLPPSTVTGHASNFEFQLNEVWEKLEKPLLNSKTPDEVTEAFNKFAGPYDREFVPRLSSDILLLLNDPDFPQRPLPRTRFLARSLAGRSVLSFRRSRDICEEADREEKRKSPHRILCREFYIECSCGYRGPALDDCCRKCGAEPQLSFDIWTGKAPEIPVAKKIRRIRKRIQAEPHMEVPVPTNPSTVQCECGATISASSREVALQALGEHRQKVHPEIVNQGTEEQPK